MLHPVDLYERLKANLTPPSGMFFRGGHRNGFHLHGMEFHSEQAFITLDMAKNGLLIVFPVLRGNQLFAHATKLHVDGIRYNIHNRYAPGHLRPWALKCRDLFGVRTTVITLSLAPNLRQVFKAVQPVGRQADVSV